MISLLILVSVVVSSRSQDVRPRNQYICERRGSDRMTLSCPDDQKLNITYAVYGRLTASICRRGAKGVLNCRASSSEDKVKSICNGKSRCVLQASSVVFGDPCKSITKYLEVSFKCVAPTPKRIFHILPSSSAKFMDRHDGLPQIKGVGRMYLENGDITWENIEGRSGPWQWLGWQSRIFAGKTLTISFSIKFVERVPNLSNEFGVKVYGVLFNKWVRKCTSDEWCYVEKTVTCRKSGDDFRIMMIFDSIRHQQKAKIKNMNVEIHERVERTYKAFDGSATIMNRRTGLPQENGVGRMYPGRVRDEKFSSREFFTWENIEDRRGSWQWYGWQNRAFANRILKISFWIKFVEQVPARSENFGIKVFGVLYNEWVDGCTPDKWCSVEKTIMCRNSGGDQYVLLIFDSIDQKQTVHVAKMKVDILRERQTFTMLATRPKIMNKYDGFPQAIGAGEMYTGNVLDTKFNPNEIITWKNNIGTPGEWQWLGWQDKAFANKELRISFWIKFLHMVPKSKEFGMKVYGVVYNEFVKGCVRNIWCYVEMVITCGSDEGDDHVILMFDPIAGRKTVRISRFNVAILRQTY